LFCERYLIQKLTHRVSFGESTDGVTVQSTVQGWLNSKEARTRTRNLEVVLQANSGSSNKNPNVQKNSGKADAANEEVS